MKQIRTLPSDCEDARVANPGTACEGESVDKATTFFSGDRKAAAVRDRKAVASVQRSQRCPTHAAGATLISAKWIQQSK